jgi:hypothetical protein
MAKDGHERKRWAFLSERITRKRIVPKGANPEWTIPQGYESYSEAEHRI